MRVNISKLQKGAGYTYHIDVRGHADGYPEVCNTMSGIMYGVIGYLANRDDVETVHKLDENSERPEAMAECWAQGRDEGLDAIWHFLAITIMQIEQSYPRAMALSMHIDEFPADRVLEP